MIEENIVKKVCKELGISQKELGDILDVQPSTMSGWATNKIPKMAQVALEQMLEIKDLKEKVTKIRELRDFIGSI